MSFPPRTGPGHVVLIFNAFPGAAATALFSDAITYRFRVRPVTSASAGAAPIFTVGEEEYTFDFTFTAPSTGDGKDAVVQAGTCNAPSGEKISFRSSTRRRRVLRAADLRWGAA